MVLRPRTQRHNYYDYYSHVICRS